VHLGLGLNQFVGTLQLAHSTTSTKTFVQPDLPEQTLCRDRSFLASWREMPGTAGGSYCSCFFWFSRALDDLSASPWKVLGRTICDGRRSTAANGKAAGHP